jgi:hypothetical protein
VKKTSVAVSSLCLTALLSSNTASALNVRGVEVGIQPRVETGLLYYEYEQDAITGTLLSTAQTFGASFFQENFRFKDTLPFASGGLTVFANRFFLDLSALTTLSEGKDGDRIAFSEFQEGRVGVEGFTTAFSSAQPTFNADFDRDEYAISLGYGVTEQLAVFAGYKWAKTDFEAQGSGPFGSVFTPDLAPGLGFSERTNLEGFVESEADFEFEYDGPFLGVNYGLEVNAGFLEGVLSFNFAAAFLDGESKVDNQQQTITITALDGIPVNPTPLEIGAQVAVESEGETVGLTFGIGWRGFTPIENLTYAVNVSGYKYEFDADNQGGPQETPDMDESAIAVKVGLGYAF